MGRSSLAPVLLVQLALLSTTEFARAQEAPATSEAAHRIEWDSDWPRFRTWEYVATGALFTTWLVVGLLPDDTPSEPRWTGGILFDDGVRDALVLDDASGRDGAAVAAIVVSAVLVTFPFLVDTVSVVWAGDRNPDVAWQMLLMGLESMALTAALGVTVERISARERPVQRECRRNPDYDTTCGETEGYQSFFSDHTAAAFTGAGLTCAHHLNLDLFGGTAADMATCAATLAAATTVGLLRVLADRHYLTDVLVGAGVGSLSGFLVPTLLHYVAGDTDEELPLDVSRVTPWFAAGSFGLGVSGRF